MNLKFILATDGRVYLIASNEFLQYPIMSWLSIDYFAQFMEDAQEFLAEARIPILPTILKAFEEE